MKKIIIDTNVLMAISEFSLDIFSAIDEFCDFTYSLYVLEGTKHELEKIKTEQRGKFKMAASLALQILKVKGVDTIPSTGHIDDRLVEFSQKGYLVLTQDVGLKKKLRKPYLTIRQRKKIVLVD